MKQWEYKIVYLSLHDDRQNSPSTLDKLGQQGWEIIHVVHQRGSPPQIWFKREVAP